MEYNIAKWKVLPQHFYKHNNLSVYFNAHQNKLTNSKIPPFYKDIHNLFIINCKTTPTIAKEILEESLWLNKNISIVKKTIHWKTWEDKGITKIGNILNKQGNFSNHIEISNKFNLKCNFIQILQIRQSIPRNIINKESIKENNTEQKLK